MHPNEPILKVLISNYLQVSQMDELPPEINMGNVKHLSKRLNDEILRTQNGNLKKLWKINEGDAKMIWEIYENLIDAIALLSIAQIQQLTEITRALGKGELEFAEKI